MGLLQYATTPSAGCAHYYMYLFVINFTLCALVVFVFLLSFWFFLMFLFSKVIMIILSVSADVFSNAGVLAMSLCKG